MKAHQISFTDNAGVGVEFETPSDTIEVISVAEEKDLNRKSAELIG